MHRFFRYPKFSETLKGCRQNFSALWDQKFWTAELEISLFYPWKLFETRIILRNSRISLWKFSAQWDILILTECDMPPLIHSFSSIPKRFWKTEGFLYETFRFGLVRQKNLTKTWCPPSYAWKFSKKKISETPKCSPMKILVQRDKNFSTENRDASPLPIHKNFVPNKFFLKHRMVPWWSFFGPVR